MDDPTIPANDRFLQYTYTGGSLVFNYDFPVYAPGSVAVFIDDTRLAFPMDYTVTISPLFAGGTVTLLATPPNNALLTIVGMTPLTRTEHYGDQPAVNPPALDAECDKTVMRLQQINTKILGCLRNTTSETEFNNTTLPHTSVRMGKIAVWDEDSGALSYIGPGGMEAYFTVDNRGSGHPLVLSFSGTVLSARTLSPGGNISMHLSGDGSLVVADASARGYNLPFSVDDWTLTDSGYKMTVPYAQHRIAPDRNILVNARDGEGNDVSLAVNVSEVGTVTLLSLEAFSGSLLIFGGISPLIAPNVLNNPMTDRGDLIGADTHGTPIRIAGGMAGQILCMGNEQKQEYRTAGACAWLGVNQPHMPVTLDDAAQIPAHYLPINSMTFKGTFGSSSSTTSGDLPTVGILDGDMYVADSDYYSAVAAIAFLAGDWAIFSDDGWQKIPRPSTDPNNAWELLQSVIIPDDGTVVDIVLDPLFNAAKYSQYYFYFNRLQIPTFSLGDVTSFSGNFMQDGIIIDANYSYNRLTSQDSVSSGSYNNATNMRLTDDNVGISISGSMRVGLFNNGFNYLEWESTLVYNRIVALSYIFQANRSAGILASTSARPTGVRFYWGDGRAFAPGGRIHVYGVRHIF
jgi:hypothetical protein